MGTTTFSGPIKAGTIQNTTGTTIGGDIANVGQVLMAQTFTTGTTLSSGASSANVTDVVVPANSQIVDIIIDIPVAIGGATCVMSIGDTVDGVATYMNGYSMAAASVGRRNPTTVIGGTLLWADTGSLDQRITWTTTGATDAGEVRITVLYQQNNNLS